VSFVQSKRPRAEDLVKHRWLAEEKGANEEEKANKEKEASQDREANGGREATDAKEEREEMERNEKMAREARQSMGQLPVRLGLNDANKYSADAYREGVLREARRLRRSAASVQWPHWSPGRQHST